MGGKYVSISAIVDCRLTFGSSGISLSLSDL